MKSVKISGKGTVEIANSIRDVELTSPGEIIIKMKACGICGSDLEKVFGKYGMSSGKLGHEPAGEVLTVGKNVKDFKKGDRVFVHHHVSCHTCHFCKHGNFTMCERYQQSNFVPCGLSDIFLVPEWNVSKGGVLKLPNTMSYEKASLIEPLACCIRALNKVKRYKGDDVAVFGAGPAGLMLVSLARLYGFDKIFLLDLNNFRLKFSKKNIEGITTINPKDEFEEIIRSNTEKRGVDLSIVATSSLNALSNAFDITRKGGTILQFGVPPKSSSFQFDIAKIYSNELTFLSSYAASELETNQALDLLKENKVDLDFLITHRFSLQKSQDAFDCAHKAIDCMKVIITSD
ncbi:MAG: alcohol dehydrogenase catalytic domain-containing protein [Nitrososphaeraceae archaeon]